MHFFDITDYGGEISAEAAAAVFVFFLLILSFLAIGYILSSLFLMKIFEKAGV